MKWYPFLNKQQDPKHKGNSLQENVTIEKENIIICQKLKYLSFGLFKNYLDFVLYMLKEVPKEQKCFYELIPGNVPQKPYFDIEFFVSKDVETPCVIDGQLTLPEKDADEAIRTLVNLVQEEIPPLTSNRSHILVFTSHKDDKRSYHVVVEGFYFSDNKSNKLFSDKIRKAMPEKWQGIIDISMYKSMQQFRIAGCCKFGTDRYKEINKELTINGYFRDKIQSGWIPKVEPESENHKHLLLIESSLITQTSGCQMLPALLDEKEESSQMLRSGTNKEYSEYFEPLTSENIKEALELCHKLAGLEYGDPRFPYSYMRVIEDNGESSIILLKRRFASMCRICNRAHQNENPFLIIAGIERDIYLDCRRNERAKKLYIGKLGLSKKAIEAKEVSLEQAETKVELVSTPVIDYTSISENLAKLSQQMAPKINYKEKKSTYKDSTPLQFKLY